MHAFAADTSTDVFLTTLKPRQRVVTAQDIESSLYYFHVASRKDEHLLASVQTPGDADTLYIKSVGNTATSSSSVIQRKPLLPKRRPTFDNGPGPAKHAYSRSQPAGPESRFVIQRKPPGLISSRIKQDREAYLPQITSMTTRPNSSGRDGILSTRREPIGNHSQLSQRALEASLTEDGSPRPRPILSRLEEMSNTRQNLGGDANRYQSINTENLPPPPTQRPIGPLPPDARPHAANVSQQFRQENIKPLRWSDQPASLGHALGIPPKPGLAQDGRAQENATEGNAMVGRQSYSDDLPDHSITLIRRDPSSGGQWNIGRLKLRTSSKTDFGIGTKMQPLQSPGFDDVQIDITTPGYIKFADSDYDSHVNIDYKDGGPRLAAHENQPIFHRRFLVKSAKALSAGQTSQNSNVSSSLEFCHSNKYQMNYSELTSRTNVALLEHGHHFTRAYSFLSPWKGVCEFSTGIAGRSLKCRHTLRSTSLSSTTVSELRFNLPSSSVLKLSASKRPAMPAQSQSIKHSFLSSSLQHNLSFNGGSNHLTNVGQCDQEHTDSDLDEPMDLSLGQERAGGGLRGRQAKLGKLIIEDEGLEMLDLLVAANMAIWWGVYGRSDE